MFKEIKNIMENLRIELKIVKRNKMENIGSINNSSGLTGNWAHLKKELVR